MTNKNDEKEQILKMSEKINELEKEDKRLNQVIIDLHKDIRKYNRKVKMQDHIIDTQQDIINALVELVSLINDKEWLNDGSN